VEVMELELDALLKASIPDDNSMMGMCVIAVIARNVIT